MPMINEPHVLNGHLVDEIIDQEVISAKARRHRLASSAELKDFAVLLAGSAPAGMSEQALRWCYARQRVQSTAKMTPAHLHALWKRYRNGGAVMPSCEQPKAKVAPGRYAQVIAHRLMRAMGMSGPSDLVPLMPGDDDILARPPSPDEADEFFSRISAAELTAWQSNPRYPYAGFAPSPSASNDNDWPW